MWLVTGRKFDVSKFTRNSDDDIVQREIEAKFSQQMADAAKCDDIFGD
jgi:hypothetical protein